MPSELTKPLVNTYPIYERMDDHTSSLIVEDASEMVTVWEDFRLMGEIGTTGINKVDAWQTYSMA